MQTYKYQLPPLPYAYDANEPYIDEQTMRIHHDKHFQTYVDNLNKAIEPYPELHRIPLDILLRYPNKIPVQIRTAIINNGGGVYNHTLYFDTIGPVQDSNIPDGNLLRDIETQFGSFDKFKELFSQSAIKLFGSGWTWLVLNQYNMLEIINTPNQDTPLQYGYRPIMLFDVWEHAYYLKYQNRRAEYVSNLWKLVNWPKVEEIYKNIQT